MDRPEQKTAHQPAEPPIDGLPRTKVNRQYLPAAARADKIAQCIDDLTKIGHPFPATPVRRRHQGGYALPFLIGQIRWIAFRLARNVGHSASLFWRPHPEFESRINPLEKPSYRISKRALTTSVPSKKAVNLFNKTPKQSCSAIMRPKHSVI